VIEGWTGIIEIAYYQVDVKSNICVVRFGEKRRLYNRYFEFSLEKTTGAIVTQPYENTPHNVQTAAITQ